MFLLWNRHCGFPLPLLPTAKRLAFPLSKRLEGLSAGAVFQPELPNARKQEALVEYLRVGPLAAAYGADLLYTCLRREPRLFARAASIPKLRETHATLAALLREDLSPKRLADALAHEPRLLLATPATLLANAQGLAAATGLGTDELTQVLREEPSLLVKPVESVELRLEWLRERLDILPGGRLMRVVRLAPLVLLLSRSKTLEPRLACLRELGVPEEMLGALVVRTPRLLHSPLESIRAKARWLREASVLAPADDFGAFVARQPDFFSMPTRVNAERLAWLQSLGMTSEVAARTVADEPALLSMSDEQLQLRASFFLRVIGGSADELAAVPHMLTCDLAKVPMLRHAYCLTRGLQVEPTQLLVKGDAVFCMEVAGCALDDLNAFEAEGKHLAFFQGAEL